MTRYLTDKEIEEFYIDQFGGIIDIKPLSVHDRVYEKTTLQLQIEIIEYEHRVSKRN